MGNRGSLWPQCDRLGVEVTTHCNSSCSHCFVRARGRHRSSLAPALVQAMVREGYETGYRRLHITGGEPLVRKDITHLISSINAIEGIEDISLTTNGVLLKRFARPLAEAGLRRVNVSLDSRRPERYREITRGGTIEDVLEGIREAEAAGLFPIKINMVPIRGFNDDEIEEFSRLTLEIPFHVRFIEFMPIGGRDLWSHDKYISTEEIRQRVSAIAPLMPVKLRKSGPARYFRFDGAPGVIGFISPITHHFCDSCNRLRLTSDGKLRPCLFSETEIDLRSALRQDADDDEIRKLLRLAVEVKPEGHAIAHERSFSHLRHMSKIGG
ncbi:MAG: GTP 3',8-cyclase MoaA [Nitrospirales bacterium]|nr:GTP 3',8-cyclase MoaA [Nitrospirales bacterium]